MAELLAGEEFYAVLLTEGLLDKLEEKGYDIDRISPECKKLIGTAANAMSSYALASLSGNRRMTGYYRGFWKRKLDESKCQSDWKGVVNDFVTQLMSRMDESDPIKTGELGQMLKQRLKERDSAIT